MRYVLWMILSLLSAFADPFLTKDSQSLLGVLKAMSHQQTTARDWLSSNQTLIVDTYAKVAGEERFRSCHPVVMLCATFQAVATYESMSLHSFLLGLDSDGLKSVTGYRWGTQAPNATEKAIYAHGKAMGLTQRILQECVAPNIRKQYPSSSFDEVLKTEYTNYYRAQTKDVVGFQLAELPSSDAGRQACFCSWEYKTAKKRENFDFFRLVSSDYITDASSTCFAQKLIKWTDRLSYRRGPLLHVGKTYFYTDAPESVFTGVIDSFGYFEDITSLVDSFCNKSLGEEGGTSYFYQNEHLPASMQSFMILSKGSESQRVDSIFNAHQAAMNNMFKSRRLT